MSQYDSEKIIRIVQQKKLNNIPSKGRNQWVFIQGFDGQAINTFIDAAKAIGLSKRKIICRHIVPNILGVVIVYATLTIPSVMMIEAFLSFLGLGIQPPMSSLGLLIRDGAQVMEEFPWMLFFPGVIFSIALFAFNFVGDGLRDAIDPKMNKK